MTRTFDPDASAAPGRLFGLPHSVDDALVPVLPVPFEATTSYRRGTAAAPAHVLEASAQVDLLDPDCGRAWERGIALDAPLPAAVALNERATADADRARAGSDAALAAVNAASAELDAAVQAWTARQLRPGRIPGILGGDHSVALGALRAAAAAHPGLGVLQIDAHADLRAAYEGFTGSHASVMHNALEAPGLGKLVQVGLRDLGHAEQDRIEQDPRIVALSDARIAGALARGEAWSAVIAGALAELPEEVWVSFDIDGLDPSLCPGTGTPVPGGLSWHQTTTLLADLVASGRRIVGFDLCEVGPGEWDAIVGARLLYKLACQAICARVGGTP